MFSKQSVALGSCLYGSVEFESWRMMRKTRVCSVLRTSEYQLSERVLTKIKISIEEFVCHLYGTFQGHRKMEQIKAQHVCLDAVQLFSETFFRIILTFPNISAFPVKQDIFYNNCFFFNNKCVKCV